MARDHLIRLCGTAAILGGLAWVVKAVAILSTGVQPALLFEVAPVLLAFGSVGLYLRLGSRTRLAVAGLALSVVAVAAAVLALLPAGGPETFSPGLLVANLSLLAALVVLGVAARRQSALRPGRVASLPLWLGVGTIPLVAVGGALAAVHERLLEIPLVLLGAGWVVLGTAVARRRSPPVAST